MFRCIALFCNMFDIYSFEVAVAALITLIDIDLILMNIKLGKNMKKRLNSIYFEYHSSSVDINTMRTIKNVSLRSSMPQISNKIQIHLRPVTFYVTSPSSSEKYNT